MTNPDKNSLSAETLQPPLGEEMPGLAALREAKGLSLADVYAKTRISVRNLAALEQGDFSALPPPVYAKAFIRQYADLIEIDPQSILVKYETYLKALEDPRPARKSEGSDRPPQGRRFGKAMGAILGILVVMAALSFFLFRPDEKQPNRSGNHTFPLDTTTPAAEPAAKPLTATETATPAPATPVTVTPTVPTNPLPPPPQAGNTLGGIPTGSQKLTIQARESTWVGIRIDQQEGQQVYLHPGDAVTYTGNQFRMDIGNAGGIDLYLQGKPLPSLGERGQVVHVTLP